MSKNDKDKRNDVPHTGSIAAESGDLSTWLHGFWHEDDAPERLEVWQVFPPRWSVRGQMIHHVDFKPNAKYDAESANHLANQIIAAAQHDCNCVKRESCYQIAITDRHRRAVQLVRLLGPLRPHITYLPAKPGEIPAEDDEEGTLPGAKTQSERYTHLHFDQIRWEKQRNDAVLGDVLRLLGDIVKDHRQENAELRSGYHRMFLDNQELLIRLRQAERTGAWDDLKIELARDGYRHGRNVLFGLFGAASQGQGPRQIAGAMLNDIKAQIGRSIERTLIDGFLRDCEREGILVKLFGEWTDKGPVKDKPGIFSFEQFTILDSIRNGDLPPDAVDEVIPGFGGKFEITFEQIALAQPIIPNGIGSAILELKEHRERKRAALQTPAHAATTNSPLRGE